MTTTMEVSRENMARLRKLGISGESSDKVFGRILDIAEVVEISDAVAPESWAGVAKFLDIGEHRFWLMVDGSIVEPST